MTPMRLTVHRCPSPSVVKRPAGTSEALLGEAGLARAHPMHLPLLLRGCRACQAQVLSS